MTDSGFCSYTNPSRATIPLIRPHQCDFEGGRIRGVLLYIDNIKNWTKASLEENVRLTEEHHGVKEVVQLEGLTLELTTPTKEK